MVVIMYCIFLCIIIIFLLVFFLIKSKEKYIKQKSECANQILVIENNQDYHYEILESIICKYKDIIGNVEIHSIHVICKYHNKSFQEYILNKYPYLKFSKPFPNKNIFYIHATYYPRQTRIINSHHFYISHSYDPTLKSTYNIFYLSPFASRNYFVANILPFQLQKRIKNNIPVYIVQGNLDNKRRDYDLLVNLLQNKFNYKYEIRIIGRGQIPKLLHPFNNKIKYYLNKSFQDYHYLFLDAYCIIPLISFEKNRQYYKNKLTSSISYIQGYKLKGLMDSKLETIYDLVDTETYNSKNDFVEAFEKTLYDFYNPKRKIVNLISYNEGIDFGDQLSVFITESLLNHDKYKLVLNQQKADFHIICGGSNIQNAFDKVFIYGSGIKIPNIHYHKFKFLKIYALRGPQSQSFLSKTKKIECLVPFGDPALLITKFYKPRIIEEYKNKIIYIPDKSEKVPNSKYVTVWPTNNFKFIIDAIYSSKGVISSSLHVLIVADTYHKPNLWINNKKQSDFIFRDYFESQHRSFFFISNLEPIFLDQFYTKGNQINLDVLHAVFPFL